MFFNWELNIGHVVTIFTLIFGIVSIFISMRYTLAALKVDVLDLKTEIKKMNDILTQLAVQDARLDMLDKRYEELRGLVFEPKH